MNYNVFKYHTVYDLVYNNSSILENFSMYSQNITITKGVDNKFYFNVMNHDRQKQQLPGKTLIFCIVNNEQDRTILQKPLLIEDKVGKYILEITKKETIDLIEGHNRGFILLKDDYTDNESLLFSGEDFNPLFEVNIVNNVVESFKPALSLNLDAMRFDDNIGAYVSEVIDSNRIENHTADVYTVAIKVKDFIGTIKIQATYENSYTSQNNEWEDIVEYEFKREATTEELEINPTKFKYPTSEIKEFTFNSQAQYFRILHIPYVKEEISGKIVKILFKK